LMLVFKFSSLVPIFLLPVKLMNATGRPSTSLLLLST
jgi:hypothetical protein